MIFKRTTVINKQKKRSSHTALLFPSRLEKAATSHNVHVELPAVDQCFLLEPVGHEWQSLFEGAGVLWPAAGRTSFDSGGLRRRAKYWPSVTLEKNIKYISPSFLLLRTSISWILSDVVSAGRAGNWGYLLWRKLWVGEIFRNVVSSENNANISVIYKSLNLCKLLL